MANIEPAAETRAPLDRTSPKLRSCVTNGKRLFSLNSIDGRAIDGRSALSRRFLIAEITNDLGGPGQLSEGQRQLIRRAAMLGIMAEAMCTVTQDGDNEGAFILDRLPSRAEAEIIRVVLRIPKRRHLSEGQREIAIARARLNAKKNASPVPAAEFSAVLWDRRHGRAVDGGRMPIFKRPHGNAGRSR